MPAEPLNVATLITLIRERGTPLVPFVGSGLTIPAGAPSVSSLARTIARHAELDLADDSDLFAVVVAADAALGVSSVRRIMSNIATGWRLRPTPALTAICGTRTKRVITTNYDDGVERAARFRGLEPIPLLPRDKRILRDPGPNELHVIHLHGIAGRPDSLVLPGDTTDALIDDEVFRTFVASVLAPHGIVHLGFSLGEDEHHLHTILGWLQGNVDDPGHHYVLLPDGAVAKRTDLAAYDIVSVVPYAADGGHTEVERVCVAFAPRAAESLPPGATGLTWVAPILIEVGHDDDPERIQQRRAALDFSLTGAADEIVPLPNAIAQPRTLIVAGPGMGKTTLLERTAGPDDDLDQHDDRPRAIARLRGFAPSSGDDLPERAIATLLRTGPDDALLSPEALDGPSARFALDGVDELPAAHREAGLEAIAAAVDRWPQHSWIVSTRPTADEAAFRDHGFVVYRIVPSRHWAQTYFDTRGVPRHRTRRAMLDGYGLGELTAIPVFAERLADVLLDDHLDMPSPLALLTEQQRRAIADEAQREGEKAVELGAWIRALALALALNGRAAAHRDELEPLPLPPGLTTTAARGRLVRASLLADVPDQASFPHKSLQDALCAQAILDADDPVVTLLAVAATEIDGSVYFRDDWDFIIDLVFEHADPQQRRALRAYDEQRWARTVLTCGGLAEAREAFALLDAWHAERGWGFSVAGDGGLRVAVATIRALGRRCPEVIEERRAQLEQDLASEDAGTARRAVEALASLGPDHPTDWLVSCLEHEQRPRILIGAAHLAGELGAHAAAPALMKLLSRSEERLWMTALHALVELVSLSELPAVVKEVPGIDGLRSVASRLLEHVDLDTTLAIIRAEGQLSPTSAWLLERVIEDVVREAWTQERVEALMYALGSHGGGGRPDPAIVATALAHHAEAAVAVAARQVTRVGDGPYGPAAALLAVARLKDEHLAADELCDLRAAIARVAADDDVRRARGEQPALARATLAAALDKHGLDLPPEALQGVGQLRLLSPEHCAQLLALVDRWWPTSGFPIVPRDAATEPDDVHRARRAVAVGAEFKAPLPFDRWVQLLDAHFSADRWHDPMDLRSNDVVGWLAHTHTPAADPVLAERMSNAPNGDILSQLIAIAGRASRSAVLTDAAYTRLATLGPETAMWLSAVGLLLEDREVAPARALLALPMSAKIRSGVISHLSRAGDPQAVGEELDALTASLAIGEIPPTPEHWWPETRQATPTDAAARLADAAHKQDAVELRDFAIGLLEHLPDPVAHTALADLVTRHGADQPLLRDAADRNARRLATRTILASIPDDLGAAAAWFDAR
jgi:hypothetical protein